MMAWQNIVLIITAPVALFAVYLEYRRANKRLVVWRSIAAIIAVLGIMGLVYPFRITTEVSNLKPGRSMITEGFDPEQIAKEDSLFTLDTAIYRQLPGVKLLPDVGYLFNNDPSGSVLDIIGYGLDDASLKALKGHPINFHPPRPPGGITAINWSQHIKAGQTFIVAGSFSNRLSRNVKLTLRALNTDLDSVNIPSERPTRFSLKTSPKTLGRTVFQLVATAGKDTVETQYIPVIIEPTQPVKILILSSSPNFETKFLKSWLGEKGYSVASRTIISKDKFGQEQLNMETADLSKISPALLSKFDAVIGDQTAISELSPAESNALQQEVSEKGIGLIVRTDSADKKISWLQNGIRTSSGHTKPTISVIYIAGQQTTSKVNITGNRISMTNDSHILVTDGHDHVLAASMLNGAGKIVWTTLNTYTWMLAGNAKDYANLWSTLLDEALRRSPAKDHWQVDTAIPTPEQEVTISSEGAFAKDGVQINNVNAYAAQDHKIPFRQTFSYWPEHSGWQQVKPDNGQPFWWYVWPKGSFKSIAAAQKLAATKRLADEQRTTISTSKGSLTKTTAPVSKMYFFILFLVSATFLWAESKFLRS